MAVTVAPAGLIPLDAPLPARRTDDLLAVSPPVEPQPGARWLGGVWTGGYPPGPAFTHDPCSHGTQRVKMNAGLIESQRSGRFTVYLPASCTPQSMGGDPQWLIDRLRAAFEIYESAAVERALVMGDGHDDIGPFLGDANMQMLAFDSVDPLSALRLLENAIAKHGGGIIHAAPSTVTTWDSLNVTTTRGALTVTKRGTPIAVGSGYIDVSPINGGTRKAGEQWAFASGPVEIYRSREIEIPASMISEILDRSLNDIYVVAERPYLFNWLGRQSVDDEDHVQAGVLIDESLGFSLVTVDGCFP